MAKCTEAAFKVMKLCSNKRRTTRAKENDEEGDKSHA